MSREGTVGIFSRDTRESYKWISDFLIGLSFVKDTKCFYITNKRSVKEDVKKCKFAILYHTKNRGRTNVTDVLDSLYHEELNDLFSALGKSNVIVIIDDLEDSSDQEKERIQLEQRSIKEKATGLFLFNIKDKFTDSNMERNLQEIEYLIRRSFQLIGFQTGTLAMGHCLKCMTVPGLLVIVYVSVCLYYNHNLIPW
ncbi:uncharacterized protein LOC108702446 [Xenopus laevis]|uniref:Uncharacterized protein LOC108702446 n=2 Tax=Xenopus laevis TaxID=8355 RepID=A0A1L8ERC8_XENLA|nr:uncharacterized protein LOC108702446 [Xenopus laevis]XP_041434806.1 uncharacterized protein LOC108702446 [Xenopus laevis]OCT61903.1 hypothetical protein XELAEV_18047935mg [Xenopus laevis]